MTTESKAVCAGCDKVWSSVHDLVGYDRFPDGKNRKFCRGRSYRSPRASCIRAFEEKAQLCPCCGKPETRPGTVCDECQINVKLGRAYAAANTNQRWYRVPFDAWLPSFYGSISCNYETRVHFGVSNDELEAVLRAVIDVTVPGHEEQPGPRYGEEITNIVPEGYKGSRYASDFTIYNSVRFKVTPAQAEAIKRILALLDALMRAQRLSGRLEGRSLLVGLASGELSLKDWTTKDNRLVDELKPKGAPTDADEEAEAQ